MNLVVIDVRNKYSQQLESYKKYVSIVILIARNIGGRNLMECIAQTWRNEIASRSL